MGCVCGKESAVDDSGEAPSSVPAPQIAAAAQQRRQLASAAVAAAAVRKQYVSGPIRAGGAPGWDEVERREATEMVKFTSGQMRVPGSIPRVAVAEQVAAGWPSWLAAVAGETIHGWVPRRAESFQRLDRIGQGTYSSVHRAHDLEKGKIVALKKVRFDNLEPESVKFMAREIGILRRLDHPNVIKLEGIITSRISSSLYLVFEYMEHDLAGLASYVGFKFSEPQIKCYVQQALSGLAHCHSRHILHRDIKGSNLLIDNNGILKLADFGLSCVFDPEYSQQMTSRVVTLWYRPPELLLGATRYGVGVDLWSLGCIIAELYFGKPIMPGRTEVEQLHKIFKLCGSPSEEYWTKSRLPHATVFKPQDPYPRCVHEVFKEFPAPALALVDTLLSVDPVDRGTAAYALKSEFFTSKPLACDPSSLPTYPPSKEVDAKKRDDEARRKSAAGNKVQNKNPENTMPLSRAVPAPDANAELASSLQKRQTEASTKSRSEMFSTHHKDVASRFPLEPSTPTVAAESSQRQFPPNRTFYSSPLVNHAYPSKAVINENPINPSVVPAASTLAAVLSEDGAATSGGQVETVYYAPKAKVSKSNTNHVDSGRKHDYKVVKGERSSKMDAPVGYGSTGKKIQYSGPLLMGPSGYDQMLRDHDRQIQEVSRRSRADKARPRKSNLVDGPHSGGDIRSSNFTIPPVYPSSSGKPVSLGPGNF